MIALVSEVLLGLALLGAVAGAGIGWRRLREAGQAIGRVCRCGYDCSATSDEALCPECGAESDQVKGLGWRFYFVMSGSALLLASSWAITNVSLRSQPFYLVHAMRLMDRDAAHEEILSRGWPHQADRQRLVINIAREVVDLDREEFRGLDDLAIRVLVDGKQHKESEGLLTTWTQWKNEDARVEFVVAACEEVRRDSLDEREPPTLILAVVEGMAQLDDVDHKRELSELLRVFGLKRTCHGLSPPRGLRVVTFPMGDAERMEGGLLAAIRHGGTARRLAIAVLWHVNEENALRVLKSISDEGIELSTQEQWYLRECNDYHRNPYKR